MLINLATLFVMILKSKVSLRAKRDNLMPLSLRAKRGNLLSKNGFLFMRLPRHFVPRNDTIMRVLHSIRNVIVKTLMNY